MAYVIVTKDGWIDHVFEDKDLVDKIVGQMKLSNPDVYIMTLMPKN